MTKALALCLLYAAWPLSLAHAETFVIEPDRAGHEAVLTIPAGAVTLLSADRAEPLAGYDGSQVEAMRLSGDVRIGIAGSTQPIEIKAYRLVVMLTADSAPGHEHQTRADVSTHKLLRSAPAGAESQVFVGNVVFDLQTSSGPMELKADRIERQSNNETGA